MEKRIHDITPEFVEFIPDKSNMKPGVLYVSEEYETAIHLCACGCGTQSVTPIPKATSIKPNWWKYERKGDVVSLSPSILNRACKFKAHYFIKDNHVLWC